MVCPVSGWPFVPYQHRIIFQQSSLVLTISSPPTYKILLELKPTMAPSTTVRRLLRETRELSASSSKPNPSFHAHPVSDEDLFEWHFTLLGPPSPSPYAGGLYHGRISLPLTYPLKPPNFRFLTPSGRFEVNREICLSISGFHEESWMPAWGIRTALVALRTFMGEEGTAGQVGGMEASKDVRQRMAKSSKQWKCDGCGGKTNEEIMQDWWEVCREKGVDVKEEAGLEELPEGLKLGFKDQIGKDERKGAAEDTQAFLVPSQITAAANSDNPVARGGSLPVAVERTTSQSESARPERLSDPLPERPTEAESITPQPMTATATATTTATAQLQAAATPILDKAISGLALALLFMVLKKVLYNPNVIAYDY
jgi:ubiquitin-conjugating enzyme E2 J1